MFRGVMNFLSTAAQPAQGQQQQPQGPVVDFLTRPPGPQPRYQGPAVDFFNFNPSASSSRPPREDLSDDPELLGSGRPGLALRGELAERQRRARELRLPPRPMYQGPAVDFFTRPPG